MPKVYLTQAQRDLATARDADDALRILVSVWRMRTRQNQKALARQLGMTDATLCRRMQSPETFTLRELRRLASTLELSRDEATRCVL